MSPLRIIAHGFACLLSFATLVIGIAGFFVKIPGVSGLYLTLTGIVASLASLFLIKGWQLKNDDIFLFAGFVCLVALIVLGLIWAFLGMWEKVEVGTLAFALTMFQILGVIDHIDLSE